MSITDSLLPADVASRSERSPSADAVDLDHARVSFRQPITSLGFVDAAWWPHSWDLTQELPSLLGDLWAVSRDITRVTYHMRTWAPAARRITVAGRVVRLGGFTVGDPNMVTLSDPWGYERIDLVVIAPDADPALAQRVFDLASQAGGTSRGPDIMNQARRDIASSESRP